MRLTQGAFSFLPDLSDEEIEAQIRYALSNGWSISVEHTDDPHPRNTYWELWGAPLFDLEPAQAGEAMAMVRACRAAQPDGYVKVVAYDPSPNRQTCALAFIAHRPDEEPGFRLEREDTSDRRQRYALRPYAVDRPAGERYGGNGAA